MRHPPSEASLGRDRNVLVFEPQEAVRRILISPQATLLSQQSRWLARCKGPPAPDRLPVQISVWRRKVRGRMLIGNFRAGHNLRRNSAEAQMGIVDRAFCGGGPGRIKPFKNVTLAGPVETLRM